MGKVLDNPEAAWAAGSSTRTAAELLVFMEQVAIEYRDAKKAIVVWDNLNIHHDGPSHH